MERIFVKLNESGGVDRLGQGSGTSTSGGNETGANDKQGQGYQAALGCDGSSTPGFDSIEVQGPRKHWFAEAVETFVRSSIVDDHYCDLPGGNDDWLCVETVCRDDTKPGFICEFCRARYVRKEH